MYLNYVLIATPMVLLLASNITLYQCWVLENRKFKSSAQLTAMLFIASLFACCYILADITNTTFVKNFSDICALITVIFGVMIPLSSIFLKKDSRVFAIIPALTTIPFSMLTIVLAFCGHIHWMLPTMYFTIPITVLAVLFIKDAVSEKHKKMTN